jgi:hypothetical protein
MLNNLQNLGHSLRPSSTRPDLAMQSLTYLHHQRDSSLNAARQLNQKQAAKRHTVHRDDQENVNQSNVANDSRSKHYLEEANHAKKKSFYSKN